MACMDHIFDFQLFSSRESHSPKEVASPMVPGPVRPMAPLAVALACPKSIGCLAEALFVIHILTLPVIIPDTITATKQGCFLIFSPFLLFGRVPSFLPCLWKSSASAVVLTGRQGHAGDSPCADPHPVFQEIETTEMQKLCLVLMSREPEALKAAGQATYNPAYIKIASTKSNRWIVKGQSVVFDCSLSKNVFSTSMDWIK